LHNHRGVLDLSSLSQALVFEKILKNEVDKKTFELYMVLRTRRETTQLLDELQSRIQSLEKYAGRCSPPVIDVD
jgi:hypothetical protein